MLLGRIVLEVLLSCGAAIDGMDGDRRTLLQVAVEERALDSVGFLLDQGASMIRADSEFIRNRLIISS